MTYPEGLTRSPPPLFSSNVTFGPEGVLVQDTYGKTIHVRSPGRPGPSGSVYDEETQSLEVNLSD